MGGHQNVRCSDPARHCAWRLLWRAARNRSVDLFWGLIASMWLGNLMLVILNLPLIGVWVSLLKVPYRLLFPCIMAFSAIGIYSVNNSSFEIYMTAFFGIIGFLWLRLDC